MSNTSYSPIFKLNFEQTGSTLTDLTGNGYDATVKSTTACTPVAGDPMMGNCLQFDGSSDGYCTIAQNLNGTGMADLSNGLTMCAWVNFTKYTISSNLLQLGAGADIVALVIGSGTPVYVNAGKPQGNMLPKVGAIGQWHHVAMTVDSNGELIFYMDGVALKPVTNPVDKLAEGFKTTSIQIGGKDFEAMLAWLSVYNGPLSPTEILADMAEGQANRGSDFRQSFPLEFKLYSDDGGAESPIMFIEDKGDGQDLNLRVINNNRHKPISISPGKLPVTAQNCHFQLEFRPGILSDNFVTGGKTSTALQTEDWSAVTLPNSSGTISIYFLYTGAQALSVGPKAECPIIINSVNASATGGSRNTNVSFKYQNISLGQSPTPIEGHRTQNISLVNHAGNKDITLRAEVVGMASVMTYPKSTDGSLVANPPQSDLMFRLVNTGLKDLTLNLPGGTQKATEFILSIDVQPAGQFLEYALMDIGDIGNLSVVLDAIGVVRSCETNMITLEEPLSEDLTSGEKLNFSGLNGSMTIGANGAKAGDYHIPILNQYNSVISVGAIVTKTNAIGNWLATPNFSASSVTEGPLQWTIKNQGLSSLAPNKAVTFLLSGIICSLPAGSSAISIQYNHVPNHWDGQFSLPIQKSPISYNGNMMGINTQEPEASLHIMEKAGNTPFRIEKKSTLKLPTPAATWQVNMPDLIYIAENTWVAAQTYGKQAENAVYLEVYSFDGTKMTNSYVKLDNEIYSVEGINSSSTVAFANNVFCIMEQTESQSVNLYSYNGAGVVTFSNQINLGQDIRGFKLSGTYALFLLYSKDIAVYDIANPASPTSSSTLSVGGAIDEFHDWALSNNSLYLLYMPTSGSEDTFQVYQLANGSLTEKGNLSLAHKGNISVFGDKAFVTVTDSNCDIYVIDSSDPSSPKLEQTLHQDYYYSGRALLIEDSLIVGTNGQQFNVYAYTKTGFATIPEKIATEIGWCDVGLVGDAFYVTNNSGSGTTGTQLYAVNDVMSAIAGENLYLTANQIGVRNLASNAYINLPYPSTSGQNGIVIGDAAVCEDSALAIATNGSTTTDAISVITDGQTVFSVSANGSIASGINTPCLAIGLPGTVSPVPLYVAPNANYTGGYLENATSGYNYGGNGSSQVTGANVNSSNTSIYANGSVLGLNFVALSDVRVKEHIAVSNADQSLATLLKLKVSDYQYIDYIGKGAGQKRGLIAQEVKAVFPQAVSAENTDFIPDIYAMATELHWHEGPQQLSISLEKTHDLKPGDRVRLIADRSFEEKEVVEVPNAQSFVIADWQEPIDRLFVFGKEVSDCHSVDYDQVAMLGVSAIQALHQKAEAQDERINSIAKENESLKEELAALRQDLRDFKTALSKQHSN